MPTGQPDQSKPSAQKSSAQPTAESAAKTKPSAASSGASDWFQALGNRFGNVVSEPKQAETAPDAAPNVQTKAKQLTERLAEERRRAAWLSGFRFSAFSLILAGVLVVGVLSLIPRVQELVSQRQQISALKADIAATQADTQQKQTERQQWSDPTYVETQARERLYFVQPGDVSYLVINDLTPAQLASSTGQQATDTVQQTQGNWLGTLLGSVWTAGNTPISSTDGSTPSPTETSSQ